MVHRNDYDESTPIRDARTAQDVRFLMRGLRQMAVDPQAEVPADFHAAVMSRVRAQPLPRKRLQDWVGERLTVWAPVFAIGLLLSLGVHVWQGIRPFWPRQSAMPQTAEMPLGSHGIAGPLPTYQFQRAMQRPQQLAVVVVARESPKVPTAMVGFTPQVTRSTFVRLGTLYADTLAALAGGAVEAAVQRLEGLRQTLLSIQAPAALPQYLGEMQVLLQRQPSESATWAQFVALFEPLYEEVYAKDATAERWVLFQTGAWLENLSLAAATDDQAALRQAPAVQSLSDALRQLNVPPDVLAALARLRGLLARQPLSDQDMRAIQSVLQSLQKTLHGESDTGG
jgi:hypothetical protein